MTHRGRIPILNMTWAEVALVGAVIVALAVLASPMCGVGSADRAKEAVLKTNLHTLREVIAQYHRDHGSHPATLETLVDAGYLRRVPQDPMTDSTETWELTYGGSTGAQIVAVRSGAGGTGIDGSPYRSW